jgi:hypothetical protein
VISEEVIEGDEGKVIALSEINLAFKLLNLFSNIGISLITGNICLA